MVSFPPWCPARVIDPTSGKEVEIGNEGVLAVFDLANIGSVSSLLVGDWARRSEHGFEILGRTVASEIRGCSLAVEQRCPCPLCEFNR